MTRLLLLMLAGIAWSAQALPQDTWVVVVGNNEGMGTDVTLLYAEADATAVSDALKLNAGVSGSRVQALLGENAEAVRRTLIDLNATIRAHTSEGKPTALIVFYSGHADATALHLGTTQLQLDELKDLVEGSAAGVRVLIVDACRSGALTRVKGVKAAPSFALELKDSVATEGTAIITSSASGESSQESDRLSGSFFTHHLVNALRGAADTDGDGKVTLTEAYAYTYAQTLRSSGDTVALQHPTYAYDVKGRGDLVLSQPTAAGGKVGRLILGTDALHLVTREKREGPVVAEVVPQGTRRELSLPAQKYFVQERRPTEYREYEISLGAGDVVDLAQTPSRIVRYDRLVRQRGGEATLSGHFLALGGARGPVVVGSVTGPQVQVGAGFDFPWASIDARVRGSTGTGVSIDQQLQRREWELAGGVLAARTFDFPVVSLSLGVLAELVFFRQDFQERMVSSRTAFGGTFAAVVAAEFPLVSGFSVRVEGGPAGTLFPLEAPDGKVTIRTAVTGFVSGGIAWHR